jgi:integrase
MAAPRKYPEEVRDRAIRVGRDLVDTALHGRRLLPRHRAAQHPPCRGGLIYDEPKARRSQRTLALPHAAGRRTSRAQGRAIWRADAASSGRHDEDLVFAHANGRAIDKKTDYDDWTALLQKAGVRHVRLHDGRHTAATIPLSENVHPRVVMELDGHSRCAPRGASAAMSCRPWPARRPTGRTPCC